MGWRRGWDSNPRYRFLSVQSLSRRSCSATPAPLLLLEYIPLILPFFREYSNHSSDNRHLHFMNTERKNGGGRGIRTPVTIAREAIFKTAAFNHSAIPPQGDFFEWGVLFYRIIRSFPIRSYMAAAPWGQQQSRLPVDSSLK